MLKKKHDAEQPDLVVENYLKQVLAKGRDPKFTLLDREYNHVDKLQIGGKFSFDGSQRHDAVYIFGHKLYYIDYDASQMQPRDRIPLAERHYDGKMYVDPSNGNSYDKNNYRLVEQSQIIRFHNNLYYPDSSKSKLDFSKKKTANNQFFEINGVIYEKKDSFFIDVRNPDKIYTEEGVRLRQLNNHQAIALYPQKQENIDKFSRTPGPENVTADPTKTELKIDTSNRAFYVQITDPSLYNPGSQAKAITVDLNITHPETGATEKHQITLHLEENNPNVPPGTYRSDLLLLTNYNHANGRQLAAEPGSEISVTYTSHIPSTRVENGVTISESKTITAPLGKVPVEKVLELDVFVVVDDDINNNNASQENTLKERQALFNAHYLKKEMALAEVQVKINGPFLVNKSLVYEGGSQTFVDSEMTAAIADNQHPSPKDTLGRPTHLRMIVGAENHRTYYNEKPYPPKLPVATNTFFIDNENGKMTLDNPRETLESTMRILVEPQFKKTNTDELTIHGLTPELANTAKKSSLMTTPPAETQSQKTTPALTP
ncbi:MAG: hypothetical protein K1X66_09145 [Verrucomicrobiae bacterium]|nr:hypothetical protein [Verrucomicrobiae bacterium]